MSKFITTNFWFQSNPELTSTYVNSLLGLSLVALALCIYAYVKQKEKTIFRIYWRGLLSFGIWNFIVFTLWWFFSFEAVPVLSARIWLVFMLVVDLVWVWRLRKRYVKQGNISTELAAKKTNKKYIP